MFLNKFFYFSFLLGTLNAFEYIRNALRNIDRNVEPCDNFYRHVCPPGEYDFALDIAVKPIADELFAQQKKNVWENFSILKDIHDIKLDELPDTLADHAAQMFEKHCNDGFDTIPLLTRIEHIYYGSTSKPCEGSMCLQFLDGDKNCTRSVNHLRDAIKLSASFYEPVNFFWFKQDLAIIVEKIRIVNALLDGGLTGGVQIVTSFIDDLKEILVELIQETPWVKNQGIEEAIVQRTQELTLYGNYGVQLRESIELLFKLESNYLKCMLDISSELFCLKYSEVIVQDPTTDGVMQLEFNAFNGHPNVILSFPLYFIAGGDDEMAGKIGFVGQISAHELGHTLIEQPEVKFLLPYSSAETIQCIQNQFNATCEEFREESCEIGDEQIDDNGADMLGMQLAYKLFENYYGDRKDEVYLHLTHANITMEQLFFYGVGLTLCSGRPGEGVATTHAANNVRINTMGTHPAFQQAFQCAPESRMMKTVQEPCIIYGKNAPEQRKH